jgi:hypothetical protein
LALVLVAASLQVVLSGHALASTRGGESGAAVRGTTIDVSARVRSDLGIPSTSIDNAKSGGCVKWETWWSAAGYATPQNPDVPGSDLDGIENRGGIKFHEYWAFDCNPDVAARQELWHGWIPQLSGSDLLPLLLEELRSRQLAAPEVTFVGLDPEFDWAYVKVPVGFRIGNTGPVTVTARVAAGPLAAWASMTATPSAIRFDPGEPDGHSVSCTAEGAAAGGFDSARPGECSYTYVNSSAIAPNGRTFTTTTNMTYALTYRSSSGAGSFPDVTTTSSSELGVAEVQALVTCTGPRPEQGGCG